MYSPSQEVPGSLGTVVRKLLPINGLKFWVLSNDGCRWVGGPFHRNMAGACGKILQFVFQDAVYHLRKQFPFLFFGIPFKYRGCHVFFENHISTYVRLSMLKIHRSDPHKHDLSNS